MVTNLPDGYTFHPVSLADVAQAVELYNTVSQAYLGKPTDSLEDVKSGWQAPVFNLATDACKVLGPGGECAAVAEFWDANAPHVRYNVRVAVHPRHEGRGIGSYLLDWAEERAQRSLPLAPESATVKLQQFVDVRMCPSIDFLGRHGYACVRNAYHMHIALDQRPPAPVLPPGFCIRPFEGEDERRELIQTLYDAFHDHWGFVEEPFESYYQRWIYLGSHMKELEPGLWFLAIKDGAIAGACIGANHLAEDPEMGWVHMLGVRRAYRKQGLGLAFLHTAFGEFYRRGRKRAGLGVDASSLTGAVRLYETAGMHVARQFSTYEKVVRDGVELGTEAIRDD